VGRRAADIDAAAYRHVAVDLAEIDQVRRSLEPLLIEALASESWQRVGLVNNAARADLLGPIENVDATELSRMFTLNVVAPMRLMGLVASRAPQGAALRIVNVSSGAAVHAFPGLAAYGASKAALRMAGMDLAAELDAPPPGTPSRSDAAILSYEPGTVDTPMQESTRSISVEAFPWVGVFHRFHAEGRLVKPEQPAAEIAGFLGSTRANRFSERRFGAE
jgi:NAD(P)-dependent dehydrogenase (short-subunit alcohol dehydrogenase family)